MTPIQPNIQRKLAGYGLLLTFGLGGVVAYTRAQREIGRRDVLLAQSRREADSLRTLSKQIEVRFQRDTIRLRQVVAHTDTLVEQVTTRLTDTVFVKQVIAAQDTAIKVCRVTLTDCAKGWDTAKRQVSVLETQVRLLEASRPSVVGRILNYGIAAGLGYAVGRTIH